MRRRPGRYRRRLAELLEAAGFDVNADELDTQEGAYRGPHWDLARWFAHCYRDGKQVYLYSWNTMGECVKYGVTIGDLQYPNSYEIHANL
jgi:hypothetical protein